MENILFHDWTRKNFTHKEISEIIEVTKDGFGMIMDEEEINELVNEEKKIFIMTHDEKIIGFSSIIDMAGIDYLYAIAIHSEYQKKGIYARFHTDILQKKYQQILLRTQNMNIIQGAKKSGWEVYVGREAWLEIENSVRMEEINKHPNGSDFMNGVFPGMYIKHLGSSERVRYISDKDYPGFNAERGDALLVLLRKGDDQKKFNMSP